MTKMIRRFVETVRLLLAVAMGLLLVAGLTGCASVDLPKIDPAGPQFNQAALANKEIVQLPPKPAPFAVADTILGVPPAPVPQSEDTLYDVISVYWGTDRKIAPATPTSAIETSAAATAGQRGLRRISAPGSIRGHRLHLGRAHVTVPKIAREKGTLQRPWQITFLNYKLYAVDEDPRKHFTIGSLDLMDEATFAAEADKHLSRADRFKDQAFVFVHGFNNTFEDALYRTAQIAHDLEFDGVPYMYSWPSRGEDKGYLYDRDSADRARAYFLRFLRFVAEKTKAKRIHIIAHSLGIRPLAEALQFAKLQGLTRDDLKLEQVILAAPDIDRDVFAEIAETMTNSSKGTTLYVSRNDRALQASRTLALGKPRAGEVTTDGPMIVKGIDTIDVSQAGNNSWLSYNHATYADSSHLLTDLRLLLRSGIRPPDRRFPVYQMRELAGIGRYWQYVKN